MSDNPTCATCRWWDADERDLADVAGGFERYRECRIRSTPGLFPSRRQDSWCGEYAPRADGGDHPKGGHDEAEGRGESPDASR